MKLWVITAFRNRPDLLGPCLESIDAQGDSDFGVLVGDDASDEGVTGIDYLLGRDGPFWGTGWDTVRRPERFGVVRNQATLIRSVPMAPEDVIVFLDGDDRFAHPDVLARVREVYSDPMVDLSYGNYRPDPPDEGCPSIQWVPPEVCAKVGEYRRWTKANGTPWNHLRCFRRRIFDAIPEGHMKIGRNWLDGGADYALMTPAFELAGGRHYMFEEVLVLYTSDRPDAEWRSKSAGIARGRRHVTTRRPLRPLPPMST